MPDNLAISIGNISIALESDIQDGRVPITPVYGPFAGPGKADLTLRLRRGTVDTRAGKKIFDCPQIWTLYRSGNRAIIKIFPGQARLERTLILPSPLKNADLFFSPAADLFIDPFFGPVIELLMLNYLAQGRGVILHACGIARNGQGLLFVGKSGAGKSTLANLWHPEPGVEIFSDDRMIVRKQGDALWMYGTPWHGTARFGSPRRAEIKKIFFIRHGHENSLAATKECEAAAKLITCAFPPHWDADGMAFTLSFLNDLVARHPCRELSFRPDSSAVEFVMRDED